MDNKRNEFLKVYNEFCEREYEEVSLKKIPEDGIFGIAYTTGDEKEKYTLQLDYDINHEKYIFSINDEIICKEYTSISEAIEEIEMGTFEGYYDYMLDKAEEHGITFDEVEKTPFELWLDRDDASAFKSEYECFIKVKINTSMYLIYSAFDRGLYTKPEVVGIYKESSKELYGNSYYFSVSYNNHSELKTSYYLGSFDAVLERYNKHFTSTICNYKSEHKEELKHIASQHGGLRDTTIEEAKATAAKAYIKQIDLLPDNVVKFEDLNIVIKYLENPKETIENEFNEWLKEVHYYYLAGKNGKDISNRDRLGYDILYDEEVQKEYDYLINNPHNKYHTRREVYAAIKDIDAINLNVKINDISRKISKQDIELDIVNQNRTWQIDNIDNIQEITYRKNVLYKKNETANKKEKAEQKDLDDMEIEM